MKSKQWPQLYATSSKGKIKTWKIEVREAEEGTADMITWHGYVDSNLTETVKNIDKGKNIGKANETTPFEQAVANAESKWKKKHDKGYSENKDGGNKTQIRPMLAHKYIDRGHEIKFPCYAQEKLNGVRCIAFLEDGEVILQSRGGKRYEFQEHLRHQIWKILKELEEQVPDLHLDGELYLRGMSLQEIGKVTRKQKGDEDRGAKVGLEYWIYDAFSPSVPEWTFHDRYFTVHDAYWNIFTDGPRIKHTHVRMVYTSMKANERELLEQYERHVEMGAEGTIVRNVNSHYKLGHRSADLQKMKPFQDGEYKIVGAFEGTGTEKGCVNWTCDVGDGRTFGVRPRGSFEERKKMWKDREQYIGKMLTVTYQELTNDGIPHICVGEAIRDYE